MKTYPFIQIDAFTDKPLAGNPCAVFFDCEDMDDETILAITREMNLSECAFLIPSVNADFGVRYFTPMGEIPLAGHPTIATVFALIESGRLQLKSESMIISLELKVGPIPVEIKSRAGKVERITMTQKRPQFLQVYEPAEVLPVFGLTQLDLAPDSPIQTVSTGTPQLMIHVRDLAVLRRLNTNATAYQQLHASGDWFSTHIFCMQAINPNAATFARHLSPPPDIFEDPFTGSATGGMATYLWHYGHLKNPTFVAEQGHWMQRPGQAFVEVIGPRAEIETVKVGGMAVSVLNGTLKLPEE